MAKQGNVSAVFTLTSLAVATVLALLLLHSNEMAPTAYAAGDCTVSAQDEAFDAEEQSMLSKINQYRAQNNVAALTASAGPNKAAAWMSRDMATKNYFDHYDLSGRSPFDRMADCGYRSTTMGENIGAATGYGTNTADIIFDGWKRSPAHDAAMKNGTFKAAGIARTCLGTDCYWTLDLGAHVDSALAGGTTPNVTAPTPAPTSQTVSSVVPTAIPIGNTGATLAFLQNVAPTVAPTAPRSAIATPIPTTVPSSLLSVAPSTNVVPSGGSVNSAAPAAVAPTATASSWLDGPASSTRSVRGCPIARSWAIVYWDGPSLEIARAAALCPGVERFWTHQGGRWYGYSAGNPQSSDPWTLDAGEAVFAKLS